MPSANASVYTTTLAPSVAPAHRTGSFKARPHGLLDDELGRTLREFPKPVSVRVDAILPRRWEPMAEPPITGLGPSVAELTIGRPPRAPRPGE